MFFNRKSGKANILWHDQGGKDVDQVGKINCKEIAQDRKRCRKTVYEAKTNNL